MIVLVELKNGLVAKAVWRKTGISEACQSWQWIISGLKPITGMIARTALQKKVNLSISHFTSDE
jgi:hypothetical protein